jgi:hypothetical protein
MKRTDRLIHFSVALLVVLLLAIICGTAHANVWQLDFEQGRCVEFAGDVQKFYLEIHTSGRFQPMPFLTFHTDEDDGGNPKAVWIYDETVEQHREDQRRAVQWVFTPTRELCEKLRALLGVEPTGQQTTAQFRGGRVKAKGWWNQ